jgi:hypothetical protein
MTNNNPVSGKGHIRDVVMVEAIAELAVRSFLQPVFNGPHEIADAGKNGEKKKDEKVPCENCHDRISLDKQV